MDPISNVDRLVILLRQKLIERSRKVAGEKRAGKGLAAGTRPTAIEALASAENVDEHVLRREVIQSLLADQFGPEIINDAQFQTIISRVTEAIEENAETANLLRRIISGLRQS